MANDPDLTEAMHLAETLRATIDNLDERIEQRARELAAQRGPLSVGDLSTEVPALAQRLGELMRRTMLAHRPEDREITERIAAEDWTADAAHLLSRAYALIAEREGEQHG